MSYENWLTRRKGLLFCVTLFVKAFGGAEPCVGSGHWENYLQPCLFFSGPTCLCCSENCCTALGRQRSQSQYLAQHEHLLLNTSIASPADSSELLMKCMEMEKAQSRGEPRRAALSLIFWTALSFFPFLWKKKNWMTVVIYRYRLRISKG